MNQVRLGAFLMVAGVALASWMLTCAAWQFDRVAEGVRPLEPRSFERLTLVTAGTGGAWENPSRLGPVLAIGSGEQLLLVDAGRGVAEALRGAGLPLAQPRVVLLTSLLAENSVGLDDLALTGWQAGRDAPLRVVGPVGTRALAEGLVSAHAAARDVGAGSLGLSAANAALQAEEVTAEFDEVIGGVRVRARVLPGAPLPALAWRFDAGDRGIAISPNPWGAQVQVELARGAQVWVQEGASIPTAEEVREHQLEVDPEQLAREATLHTSVRDVGPLAHQAGVEVLVLVRLRPPPVYDFQLTRTVSGSFGGRILLPEDGDEITP